MKLEELRKQHQNFVFDSYQITFDKNTLSIEYCFLLEPELYFKPVIKIPLPSAGEKRCEITKGGRLEDLIFHLGLIEMISYWKAACPRTIVIKAGFLTSDQIAWWKKLFIQGLGEFYYKNQIDFSSDSFLEFVIANKEKVRAPSNDDERGNKLTSKSLVLVGGGKDSTVTLELLRQISQRQFTAFFLNPIRAARDSARIAGYLENISVERAIDPLLIDLNSKGYLNGHTPFSAYLAFLSLLVAELYGYDEIIASNERSASEPNLFYKGVAINHQYSKSFDFEQKFRDYANRHLSKKIHYFSFLRPISDDSISQIFSKLSAHHLSFRSCNVNQKKDSWCKSCAKCASVYLSLFPFLSYEITTRIFGEDLFFRPEILTYIKMLVGQTANKPFECVGGEVEARHLVRLSVSKYHKIGIAPASEFLAINEQLPADIPKLELWSSEHNLPENYQTVLRNALVRGEE